MAFSNKGARRITVRETEYRWKATGSDGAITMTVYPSNEVGPCLQTYFDYQETWIDKGDHRSSAGDQVIVTSRLVRRVIEFALDELDYNPNAPGKQMLIREIENHIQMDDAVRAKRKDE